MIDELASRCFATRDAAHREHWATASFATHKALEMFYEGLPERLDSLIECYQGMYGRIDPFGVTLPAAEGGIVERMQDDIEWLQATRDDTTNGDPSLLNKLDEIVALYQQTVYRITHLS